MSLFSFKGGIHMYDGKELSKDKAVATYKPTGPCVFSLQQHIGKPAIPLVEVGEYVLAGQKIAEADGDFSASVFSSVSGKVSLIEDRLLPTGDFGKCIVIENDGLFEPAKIRKPVNENLMLDEDIIAAVKNAGIVGMGGAGFPTHIKLSPKDPDSIQYVIANCAECEPYLTSDYRRMIEEGDKLIEGLKIILRLFRNARAIIAIEDNKPDCIKKLKSLSSAEEKISVVTLKTKYPQGSERHLIYSITGRKINSSMLPADAGCIVSNIDTICCVRNAVKEGLPLTHRIITVSGDCIKNPQNFNVPIGTSYKELIDAAGGFTKEPKRIISGGPMMGTALFDLNIPITKSSSAILAFSQDETDFKETACINCGRCASVCPGRVLPSKLALYSEKGDEENFLKYNGMECCECGCCAYVCPAKRQLTLSIKTMKHTVSLNNTKGQD